MQSKSTSRRAISPSVGRRLPRHRPPTHPGVMLLEEFLKPSGISRARLARLLEVPYPLLNGIVRGRRSVSADTALRLARVLGTSAEFWLGLQAAWDLWHAMHGPGADEIARLEPLARGGAKAT